MAGYSHSSQGSFWALGVRSLEEDARSNKEGDLDNADRGAVFRVLRQKSRVLEKKQNQHDLLRTFSTLHFATHSVVEETRTESCNPKLQVTAEGSTV